MNDDGSSMRLLGEILHDRGWGRAVPDSLIAILPILLIDGPMSRNDLDLALREDPHSQDGLQSHAWEPLHEWSDQELAELRAEYADAPFATDPDDERSADEVNVAEAEARAKRLDDMVRYFEAHDLPVDHSIGGLVDLLIACRVLTLSQNSDLSVNLAAPLPGEVLPLDPEEAALADDLRWRRIHEATAQAVIQLFDPDEQEISELKTSVFELSQRLELHPESIRSGLQNLIDEGDFRASIDVTTVELDRLFDLHVDWDRFNQTRFTVHLPTDEADNSEA